MYDKYTKYDRQVYNIVILFRPKPCPPCPHRTYYQGASWCTLGRMRQGPRGRQLSGETAHVGPDSGGTSSIKTCITVGL